MLFFFCCADNKYKCVSFARHRHCLWMKPANSIFALVTFPCALLLRLPFGSGPGGGKQKRKLVIIMKIETEGEWYLKVVSGAVTHYGLETILDFAYENMMCSRPAPSTSASEGFCIPLDVVETRLWAASLCPYREQWPCFFPLIHDVRACFVREHSLEYSVFFFTLFRSHIQASFFQLPVSLFQWLFVSCFLLL